MTHFRDIHPYINRQMIQYAPVAYRGSPKFQLPNAAAKGNHRRPYISISDYSDFVLVTVWCFCIGFVYCYRCLPLRREKHILTILVFLLFIYLPNHAKTQTFSLEAFRVHK